MKIPKLFFKFHKCCPNRLSDRDKNDPDFKKSSGALFVETQIVAVGGKTLPNTQLLPLSSLEEKMKRVHMLPTLCVCLVVRDRWVIRKSIELFLVSSSDNSHPTSMCTQNVWGGHPPRSFWCLNIQKPIIGGRVFCSFYIWWHQALMENRKV